jgi:sorting nexin-3/12
MNLKFSNQTAEDRYGVPENFLEVEVRDPQMQNKYVDYEIVCRVSNY